MKLKILSKINLIFLFFLIGTQLISAQTSVSGQIFPGKNYPLELLSYDIKTNKYRFDRKLELSNEGVFQFKISNNPNLYKLSLNGEEIIFINDGDKNITINIDLNNRNYPFKILGSTATNQYLNYFTTVNKLQEKYLNPLEPRMAAALKAKDEKMLEQIEELHQKNLKLFVDELDSKISKMGSSLSVFAIIRTLDFNKYLTFIEKWQTSFLKERPKSPFTVKIKELIDRSKRTQIGNIAPEIDLETLAGKKLKLSAFRGKIVLVDFWASWCLPCRKENHIFNGVYAKYYKEGFEIWSISTDEDQKKWKKAIEKDAITWTQSRSTDKTVESMYNVVALPSNFLIDEKGTIIAKNLSAKSVESILKNKFE